MERYTHAAKWYDALSGEPIYRAGRMAAITALRLAPGERVLDIGCGTGLNFQPILEQIRPTGCLVGLDRSPQMLSIAQAKTELWRTDSVRLVSGDAEASGEAPLRHRILDGDALFDAALCTYSLSLMPQWERAWTGALSLVRAGGRIAVVDMGLPRGRAKPLRPLARFACWAGGADVDAHPWRAVESDTELIARSGLRGGHIQVRVGVVQVAG